MALQQAIIVTIVAIVSITCAQDTFSRPIYGITNATASRFCEKLNTTTNQIIRFVADERNTCWLVDYSFLSTAFQSSKPGNLLVHMLRVSHYVLSSTCTSHSVWAWPL